MTTSDEGDGVPAGRSGLRVWSTPRVVVSELRSARHLVGLTPLDKITGATDVATASGSQGS
jgi:hypothetical protein